MEFKIDNKKTFCFAAIFVILFYWAVNHLNVLAGAVGMAIGILAPFLLGGAIAFVLNVPMKFIERCMKKFIKGKRMLIRFLSMFLSFALAFGIIAFVLVTVIPEMINTVIALNEGIPQFIDQIDGWLKGMANTYPEITNYISTIELNWASIAEKALSILQSGATNILSSTWGIATSTIGVLAKVFLGVMFSMYLLVQKEKLGIQVKKLTYAYLSLRKADRTLEIASLSNKTFSGFIAGQCTEALIFGLLCYIGMLIFQFPYAVSISVLIGFTTLIPVLGAFIGTALGAVLIVVVNPLQALAFVAFIVVLQQIDENLIYPRVVGNSVGLPGLWVMIAVIVGGSLMGVLGMLIFVPLVSVLYCLLREAVYKRLAKKQVSSKKYEE